MSTQSAYDDWDRLREPTPLELFHLNKLANTIEPEVAAEVFWEEQAKFNEEHKFTFLEEIALEARVALANLKSEWRRKHPHGEVERKDDEAGNPFPETMAALSGVKPHKAMSDELYCRLRGKAVRYIVRGMLPRCPDKATFEDIVYTIKCLMETKKVKGSARRKTVHAFRKQRKAKTAADWRNILKELGERIQHEPSNNGELLLPGIRSRRNFRTGGRSGSKWPRRHLRVPIPKAEQLGTLLAESEEIEKSRFRLSVR